MCDGYYHKTNKTIIISTDSFSLNKVDTLRDILLSKYNIKSYRYLNGHKCKNQYKNFISKKISY
jgi:hypothetical protein